MPEIAEVESVARVLDSKYIGKKLIKIETFNLKYVIKGKRRIEKNESSIK